MCIRDRGGSIWETVVDGELNSLSQPSAYIIKLFVGAEDDFYVWINSAGTDTVSYTHLGERGVRRYCAGL